MGSNSSSLAELGSNEYLQKFVGKESIPKEDEFWKKLLSYSFDIPHTTSDARLLEEATLELCKSLAAQNLLTGNFCTLVEIFLERVSDLKNYVKTENHVNTWQTYNALFIIRRVLKYFLEHLSEGRVLQQMSVLSDANNDVPVSSQLALSDNQEPLKENLLQKLIHSLIKMLVEVPVLNFTYIIHLEAINTLLTLLSLQLYIPRIHNKSIILQYFMKGTCSEDAHILIKMLLDNFIKYEECPPELLGEPEESVSFLYGLTAAVAAGLWAVLTLGYGVKTTKDETKKNNALLANQSLHLVLVLTHHYTHDKGAHNPYRKALSTFANSQDGGLASHLSGQPPPPFKINFTNLYEAFCNHLNDDQTTLLLYSLLHQNINFRTFILAKTNIDLLLIPLLRILYDAQEKNSHHIYMALIVLLILSEDDTFNKCVHELMLKQVTWYTERAISEITLGGLIVLVVIRTIQFNMTRMRDKYLHTNCLAALANMSSQFHSLHPYVSQRIVSLFELLIKKHDKIVAQLRPIAAAQREGGLTQDQEMEQQDLLSDLAVLEEVVRMVLEIINSCLSNTLAHNPHFVYTLLYKQELFVGFKTHPKFQDIIQNIDTVLTYFSNRFDQYEGNNMTDNQVLDLIKQSILQWPRDRLRKFPELKFKYVEEEQPEEFFIPYVWTLCYQSSNLYWDPDRVELFSLNSAASN
ncbi:Dymeclin [Holothuria leucospilota]|uniref:Dymeclin n=1 Tax=Holothuria leucospilota TaxID=206669 RepID=A0A9Q1BZN1_HOLLE|nr:Dymeclin [Holothuria leucospilota]